jgi:3-deoxy-7-phosphoheptulonate synthase
MVIVMKHNATAEEINGVIEHIESLGFRAHLSAGEERTIIGVIGDERPVEPEHFELFAGVERAVRILHPFKLASREKLVFQLKHQDKQDNGSCHRTKV